MTPEAQECALCHRVVPDEELERVATSRGERRYCCWCTSAAERIVEALAASFLRALATRRSGGD